MKCDLKNKLASIWQMKFHSDFVKLSHLMWWTRPEHTVLYSNCFVISLWQVSYITKQCHLWWIIVSQKRILFFKFTRNWERKLKHLSMWFMVSLLLIVKDQENLRRILDTRVFLEEYSIMFRSDTHMHVSLSMTEDTLSGWVKCVQDMLFVMWRRYYNCWS